MQNHTNKPKATADRTNVVLAACLAPRGGNALTSRTIMLPELSILMENAPIAHTFEPIARAILEENILGKRTDSNRRKTAKLLYELYRLNTSDPVFRALRACWLADPDSRPLQVLLAASWADKHLRNSWQWLATIHPGAPATPTLLRGWLHALRPGHYSPAVLKSLSENLVAAWRQGGFVIAGANPNRRLPQVGPGAAALAVFLGFLQGGTGQSLLDTEWTARLQVSRIELLAHLRAANSAGLVQLLQAGDVLELRFANWLSTEETAFLSDHTELA